MKLHDSRVLPSPRRVRIFLAEKGIGDVEYRQVDVPGGEARKADFLALNPAGEVPVLELEDGTAISETAAICRFFEDLRPEPPLFGNTAQEKATVEMWLRRLEDGLMGAVASYFHHATPGLGDEGRYRNREWGEKSREKAKATMGQLDRQLAGQSFVAGDHFSVADIVALCAIDFADVCKIDQPEGAANLRDWYQRVSSRPSATA